VTSTRHNPLRDPQDRRLPLIAGPCSLVIFGVTGDLARKKLIPAVYDLANRGLLPPGFSLIGFARRDWEDQDFADIVYESARAHARTPFRFDDRQNTPSRVGVADGGASELQNDQLMHSGSLPRAKKNPPTIGPAGWVRFLVEKSKVRPRGARRRREFASCKFDRP